MIVLLVCLAGGLGAVCRWALDEAMARRHERWVATLVVNVTGSFALGVASHGLSADWLAVAGAGFLGAFTTFSTACWQSARALGRRNWRFAVGYAVATAAGALAAAWVGVTVAAALS